jgi:protein-tyrosine phosphatase
MAEFIFKDIVKEAGREAEFYIASAATSDETVWNGKGSRVYFYAAEELEKHFIFCEGKLSVQLKKEDYGEYDLFIGMDSANIRNMKSIFGGDPDGKIHKLMDYTGKCTDVADPWYTRKFDVTYADIYEGCTALLASLE